MDSSDPQSVPAISSRNALIGAAKGAGFTLQNALNLSAAIIFPILSNVFGWPQAVSWAVALSAIAWFFVGNALIRTSKKGPLWAIGGTISLVLIGSGVGYWLTHPVVPPAPTVPATVPPTVAAPNTTFGAKSPAVSGSGNTITYGTEPQNEAKEKK